MIDRHGDCTAAQPPSEAATDLAATGDLNTESRRILIGLKQKLESMPAIEQAKGILMARFSLDAERAFSLLVRWSQVNNLKLRAICDLLVEAAGDPGSLDRTIAALQQRTSTAGQRRSRPKGRL